ncbi:DUF1348-domain-containing protein [Karstenula rhodostoma CBS 690.94]|uniref:DUF1348-domain-containing protein n=1 Tax=Karstenula rhodostoma CBS 690.94 TaxID=1392251 RepID=A0A9P4UF57_9PLEO|nr:DUF1348-domain-containing protein [Karstenula rhodostoma CBS 690.94]
MSLNPPFTKESAKAKVKKAQDLWNTQDPKKISGAYTPASIWRNRDMFFTGTAAIEEFLTKKWEREKNYRLRKELFAFTDNKIAVQFWYEYQDAHDGMKWKRCYGLEDWVRYAKEYRAVLRQMSGNDAEIRNSERWFKGNVDVNTVLIGEKYW